MSLGYVEVLIFSICCCFNIVILMVCVAKVAKASLDKTLHENAKKRITGQSRLPTGPESPLDIQRPLMSKTEQRRIDYEIQNTNIKFL